MKNIISQETFINWTASIIVERANTDLVDY